jgi:hypothetical protein
MLCASLAHSSELVVDWSLDLSNPDQYISPPLHLVCVATKSIYTIKGTPVAGENKAVHRYQLPEEITGRCILSLGGGMEPKWYDGIHQIEINDPKGVVHTKMPGNSAPFVFNLQTKAGEAENLELHLFKLSKEGLPLPWWGYVTDFGRSLDGQIITRKFIIPFAGAGEYLAYVVEAPEGMEPRYVYAKRFAVSQDNLATHDQRSSIDDLQNDPKETVIEFTAKDAFDGIAAVTFCNRSSMRHVTVALDGSIVEVHQLPAKR